MDQQNNLSLLAIFCYLLGCVMTARTILNSVEGRALEEISSSFSRKKREVVKSFVAVSNLTGATMFSLVLDFVAQDFAPVVLSIFLVFTLSLEPLQGTLLVAMATIFSYYKVRSSRTKVIERYRESIEEALAEFIETLSIAVNSGLSLVGGFVRASDEFMISVDRQPKVVGILGAIETTAGKRRITPLQRELEWVRGEIAKGQPISNALDAMSNRLQSAIVSDFVDALVLTMARGTPLAELLNNHAQTIRDFHSRKLMERAGRAEVKMMLPVIFLLLPISVIFALWPSFQQLQQMVIMP